MDSLAAKKEVLQWATTAPSYDKIYFVKELAKTMGPEEIKLMITMLTNCKKNAKRKWLGESKKDAEENMLKKIKLSEVPSYVPEPQPVLPAWPSLPVCTGLGGEEAKLPDAWWKTFDEKDIIGFDVEFVHLKGVKGLAKIRGGKVAVVDNSYNTVFESNVYHRAGTFDTHPRMVAISGIRERDLENGMQMHEVTKKLKSLMQGKLVIVCGGSMDFSSVDLNGVPDGAQVFDLQQYYRQQKDGELDDKPMSLRDIFFMEFKWDFQGSSVHSAAEDAKATIMCFIEGYRKHMLNSPNQNNLFHRQIFEYTRLKEKDKEKQFYCKIQKRFVDFKTEKCNCNYCKILFKNQY